MMGHTETQITIELIKVFSAVGPFWVGYKLVMQFKPTIDRVADKLNTLKFDKLGLTVSETIREQQKESAGEPLVLSGPAKTGFQPILNSEIRRWADRYAKSFFATVPPVELEGTKEDVIIELTGKAHFFTIFARMAKSQSLLLEQLCTHIDGMEQLKAQELFRNYIVPVSAWREQDFFQWLAYPLRYELISIKDEKLFVTALGSDFVQFCKSNNLEIFPLA